jgi:hypothetical protein
MDENRIAHLEKGIDELYRSHRALEGTIAKLNITIVLLEQLVKDMRAEKEKRDALTAKVQFFIVGILITAVMAFILSGGLVVQ